MSGARERMALVAALERSDGWGIMHAHFAALADARQAAARTRGASAEHRAELLSETRAFLEVLEWPARERQRLLEITSKEER